MLADLWRHVINNGGVAAPRIASVVVVGVSDECRHLALLTCDSGGAIYGLLAFL